MGFRYRYVRVPPKAELDGIRQVALDAMLEGRIDEGEKLLSSAGIRLSKPQAKLAAKQLLASGATDKAMRVLVGAMGEEAAKRELSPAPTANVGDVLYTSWGYDQTQHDFYEVVAVKGSMATIREIQKRRVGGTDYADYVIGDRGAYVGPPKRVRVQKSWRGEGYTIKVNDHSAWLWDGKPQSDTASGYGH